MTANELIQKLQNIPPDTIVEFFDVTHNRPCPINSALHYNAWRGIKEPRFVLSNAFTK